MKNTHKQVNWNCVLCDLLNTFNSVVIRYSPRAKRFFPAAEDQFRREIKKFLCFWRPKIELSEIIFLKPVISGLNLEWHSSSVKRRRVNLGVSECVTTYRRAITSDYNKFNIFRRIKYGFRRKKLSRLNLFCEKIVSKWISSKNGNLIRGGSPKRKHSQIGYHEDDQIFGVEDDLLTERSAQKIKSTAKDDKIYGRLKWREIQRHILIAFRPPLFGACDKARWTLNGFVRRACE